MKFYVLTVVVTALVTLGLTALVWRLGLRYRLYPAIRERDVHTTPKPRIGGVAMFLGLLAAFALSSQIPYFAILWTNPAVNVWASSAPPPSSSRSASRTTCGTSTG